MANRVLVTNSLGSYRFFSLGLLSTEGKLSEFNANSRSGSERDLVSEKSLLQHAATRKENRH
jgi:hypothetical protein